MCHSREVGYFGSVMCVGHTLGEEILLGSPSAYRQESIQSKDASCVLQVNIKTLSHLRKQRHLQNGGTSLFEDYAKLLTILESHYI